MTRWLLLSLLALTILGLFAAQALLERWEKPLTVPEEGYVLTVERGESLRSVAQRLHREGVLEHPRLLMLYGRWTGLDAQMKHGEYRLPRYGTASTLLALLQRGEVLEYAVTLPEGITVAQAIATLQRQEALSGILDGSDDPRLFELVSPYPHPEGLFFPDTYRYRRGDSDLDVLARAHTAMRRILEEEWTSRSTGLPYADVYEALIMASLIERETGLPEERSEISGVFVRRLERGMLLQTDPTIIYGLGDSFDGNLRRIHLRDEDNPYNTYRHQGLPPTPIALPGRAAIHAALHPAPGNTLFFVARGDGGHVFSTSLADHERAVRKYQLRRRENYRSTPGKD